MKIFLNETGLADQFLPFSATRKVQDIRCGILTLKEKWQLLFGNDVLTENENEASHTFPANLLLSVFNAEHIITGKEINAEWLLQSSADIFLKNAAAITWDYELLTRKRSSVKIPAGNQFLNEQQIFIEEGAKIWGASLNASEGPVFIGKNATIMEGAFLRGPVAIGEASVVKMGAQIYGGTTLGPNCVAGGEIKNSVLFGFSNKGHHGYLGDSVIGEWCNLGAGTSNSNVKNSGADVRYSFNQNLSVNVGIKGGLLMGDYSRSAINTAFNTGTIVGVCCNIFTHVFHQKNIPDFCWGNDKYKLDKVFQDIQNWKKMKGQELTEKEISTLKNLYYKKQQS